MRLPDAVLPRDVVSAGRTAAVVVGAGSAVTFTYEVIGLVVGRSASTPGSVVLTAVLTLALVPLAVQFWRAPERLPAWLFPLTAVLGVLWVVVTDVLSADASAGGQMGLAYAVAYAAGHFRRRFAWSIWALAAVGDAIVVLSVLPLEVALTDLVVVASALAMLTFVLLTSGGHQERLVQRLDAMASVDPLTGLATRRVLERALGALPGHADVGLVLVDLDRFKGLNDRFGHPVGDAALVHVARLVRGVVREGDTVARWGGDEIAVLLPAPAAEVATRAAALHAAVRDTPLTWGDRTVPLSVSVGVAHAPRGSGDLARLYAAADVALYDAKESGRDRVASRPIEAAEQAVS